MSKQEHRVKVDLDDLERRATADAQRLDGKHGDPARAGGWIGHRDYARALVQLIPRLRQAEARQVMRHWPDCAVNHGGTECDMGPECGTPSEAATP